MDFFREIPGNCSFKILSAGRASRENRPVLLVSGREVLQHGLGAQILSSLGLSQLILMTNSPQPKVVGLDAYGLEIVGTRKISELG